MVDDDIAASETPALDSLLTWVKRLTLFGVVALAAVVLAVFAVRQEGIDRANALVRARTASRVATCQALDGMYAKHNGFVQTAIDERQQLASGFGQDPRASQLTAFFTDEIAKYRDDLVPIVDCNDPAQVAALFTPTPGG